MDPTEDLLLSTDDESTIEPMSFAEQRFRQIELDILMMRELAVDANLREIKANNMHRHGQWSEQRYQEERRLIAETVRAQAVPLDEMWLRSREYVRMAHQYRFEPWLQSFAEIESVRTPNELISYFQME